MKPSHNHLIVLLTLLGMGVLASCIKEDNDTEVKVIKEKAFNPFALADTLSVIKDSISVDFCLMNMMGDTTTEFREGEDIVFDLCIKSLTNDWLYYGNEYSLFSDQDNVFRVYAPDGSDMGTPIHLPEIGELHGRFMSKNTDVLHFRCSWLGVAKAKPSYPFTQNEYLNPLSAGEYYVAAPVHVFVDYRIQAYQWPNINEKVFMNDSIYITCGTHFLIKH